ncbi:hypothetical protein [Saccharopolyspora griseoalba]|uniref:Cache domain-containing protein n=1 Tax=Saccharopolyspora griseoalba TaxID=1431848 RepID=A0ABW2LSI5_9PSEU
MRERYLSTAADEVVEVLDDAFGWLGQLATQLHQLHAGVTRAGEVLRSEDLAALREAIFARLSEQPRLIAGTGVILAPDVLADREHWLEWWQNDSAGGAPVFLEVDHDPTSVGYYDYATAAWFARPERTGERVVVGPYVDYAGTDEYMLTLADPVRSGTRFLGVAAMDIRAKTFESLLLNSLGGVAQPVALLNATGRIVASNTPHKIAGSLVAERELDAQWPDFPVRLASAVECAGLPWRVVALHG